MCVSRAGSRLTCDEHERRLEMPTCHPPVPASSIIPGLLLSRPRVLNKAKRRQNAFRFLSLYSQYSKSRVHGVVAPRVAAGGAGGAAGTTGNRNRKQEGQEQGKEQ